MSKRGRMGVIEKRERVGSKWVEWDVKRIG